MPKCLNCNKEIDYLNNHIYSVKSYTLFIDNNTPSNVFVDFMIEQEVYACPICITELFTNRQKAIDFLSG